MSRPTRIEYADACYHVMNRGRGYQRIFHTPAYYHAFLATLADAHERFGVVTHSYCLMSNHYHLLLQTPHGNLGRVMRHINGVYTQRYNRLKHTDGPLFRGRYKAILVDEDTYLLQLSRYIHRNPLECKPPLVKTLDTYPWSSYPAFLNQTKSPAWLCRDFTYALLSHRQKYLAYRKYVEAGLDDDIKDFYTRDRMATVIGDEAFLTWVREEKWKELDDKSFVDQVLPGHFTIDHVLHGVAAYYKLESTRLMQVVKGPQKGLLARKIAMYLCQQLGGHRLRAIMHTFGLSNVGSVSFITTQIRHRITNEPDFARTIQHIIRYLIKQAA